jgi:redox-sensitive bicupin YhaK (pirin superfamily)
MSQPIQRFKTNFRPANGMESVVLSNQPMGFVRKTLDPFLFCVHHLDMYPPGNEVMGPNEPLIGRHIGSDFDESNEWKMYHGDTVPGFPAHPHRGFETVTIVLEGLVDHFDSGGATGRYGFGDVQWMTAGAGLQHSEMFPLIHQQRDNTLDLFQIWLNLPAKDKMTAPGYEMIWAETVPNVQLEGGHVRVISGSWNEIQAPRPPAASWAHDPSHDVGIYIITVNAGARLTIPQTSPGVNRMMYHINGGHAVIDGHTLKSRHGMQLNPTVEAEVHAPDTDVRVLILQGQPIDEPVAQHGPFVMNTYEEIMQAFADYRSTQFGGWPWGRSDVVHPREQGRFALLSDGRTVYPSS